jgi:hypothetical protein
LRFSDTAAAPVAAAAECDFEADGLEALDRGAGDADAEARALGGLRLLEDFENLRELLVGLGLDEELVVVVVFFTWTLTVLMTVGGRLLLKNMIDSVIEIKIGNEEEKNVLYLHSV